MRFRIIHPRDFDPIESFLASLLSGEGGRCAFLRSKSFLRFRMHVLYRGTDGTAHVWSPEGVRLDYVPDTDRGGGWVFIERHLVAAFDPTDRTADTAACAALLQDTPWHA